MKRKNNSPEQIIRKLQKIEEGQLAGKTIAEMCRVIEITEQTFYRWKKKYGGLDVGEAKRLKNLEEENARLKKLLTEAALDKSILEEALKGKL